MKSFKSTIIDPVGLHARPASMLAKIASGFESDIKIISSDEKSGNLKSIINIMALGVKQNHEITIEANGSDEVQAIEAIESEMKKLNLI